METYTKKEMQIIHSVMCDINIKLVEGKFFVDLLDKIKRNLDATPEDPAEEVPVAEVKP
jgi:hypothetical protein